MIDLVRLEWGSDNPAVRQLFTSRFFPGGTDEQLGWFTDLCRKTTSPKLAARLLESRTTIDVTHLLEKITQPTLILHSNQDEIVPIAEGHILAAGIKGSQFVELESKNHVLLESEPAWQRFCNEVLEFTGSKKSITAETAVFDTLSKREREVLALMTEGLGNARIAEDLLISEKTVRNHVSNIFDKLGVWTRSQAIVLVRDRGFVP